MVLIAPIQMPLPTAPKDKSPLHSTDRPPLPPRAEETKSVAAAATQSKSDAIPPSVDWDAELVRAGRAGSGIDPKAPVKSFNVPKGPPTIADYPEFDWNYARTHRVESIPGGGVVIHLNDNCVLALTPLPFAICSPFKRKPNGDLFKHMHDPDKPGDPRIP